jgi:hypothetical protein
VRFRMSLRFILFYVISVMLMFCLILPSFVSFNHALGQEENYTYYGVVPSKIYVYVLDDVNNLTSGWILGNDTFLNTGSPFLNGYMVAVKSLIAVVAAEDDTNVQVNDLTFNRSVFTGQIDSMEKHLVLLDNGTTFKVVSDKQVSVLLLNYQNMPAADVTEGPPPQTFYTSVDGLYVGKEFVFMASEQIALVPNKFFTILALEPATVTVTRDDGDRDEYTLDVNTYRFLMFEPFRVYRIVSTGNIMVQSGTILAALGGTRYKQSYPVPSVEGGFVGQFFLTRSEVSWYTRLDYGYLALASEDAHVKVYDLDTKQVINEFSVSGGSGISFKPSAYAIAVESDKPITLSYINNGTIEQNPVNYGAGVTFIGIRPNQVTMFYLPTEAYVEAYFFASEETQITIDTLSWTIQADSPYLFTQLGPHRVRANKNVILQINFWSNEPAYQGLWFTGAAIPCIETVDGNPNVTLTPLGEGFPTTYLIISASVAAIAVIAVFLIMKRRR